MLKRNYCAADVLSSPKIEPKKFLKKKLKLKFSFFTSKYKNFISFFCSRIFLVQFLVTTTHQLHNNFAATCMCQNFIHMDQNFLSLIFHLIQAKSCKVHNYFLHPQVPSTMNVRINCGTDAESSTVTASGHLVRVVTEAELKKFQIGTDDKLKDAVAKHLGRRPNHAYCTSPAEKKDNPSEDLFRVYGWPETTMNLIVTKTEILGFTSVPTIIASKVFSRSEEHTSELSHLRLSRMPSSA